MGRLEAKFKELEKTGKKALVTYWMAGDPDLDTTVDIVEKMAENGADIVELGVPFSDPIADGATIQRAAQRALGAGTTVEKIFDTVKRIRERTQVPIVFLTYFTVVYRFGLEKFLQKAAQAGVDGVIIPDLPPEEGDEYIKLANHYDVATVFLLAPTSTEERIKLVAEKSKGFIYCVSLTGVTGARKQVSLKLKDYISRIRNFTTLPLVVGFGISTPEQVKEVYEIADGAVVASALIDKIETSAAGKERFSGIVGDAVSALKGA